MKACPKCAREFSDSAQKFCIFDGGLLVETSLSLATVSSSTVEIRKPSGNQLVCPKCGRRFPLGQRFCTFDGGLLREVVSSEPSSIGAEQLTEAGVSNRDKPSNLRLRNEKTEDDAKRLKGSHEGEDVSSVVRPENVDRGDGGGRYEKQEVRDPYHLVGSEVELQVSSSISREKLRLLRYAGGGGMGAVYYARSPVRGEVAIKILKPDIAGKYPDISRLFSREVRAASSLEHPNIVRFIGDGLTPEGYPFVAIEWLNGVTLDKYVESSRPNVAHAMALFRQIGFGITHAHQRKIIHLDLKPENIFILGNSRASKDKVIVKIIDFGLSRVMSTYSGTTATRFAGTPQYCSPEHFGYNGKLTTRSDIFSLGLILYYVIAGVLPIGGSGIMAKQFGRPLPDLPAFRGFDNALKADHLYNVVQKSIQFAPEDRFQSMEEFLNVLEDCRVLLSSARCGCFA